MITLGYEDDIYISKVDIAKVQLTEAINLFLVGKYLCAITLAGASEEIFARILNQQGEASVVEKSVKKIQEIRELTGLSAMGGKPKNEIFNEWNSARNTLKHHRPIDSKTVKINLFDQAYWIIKRALMNAEMLKENISNRVDFENWIIQNINM